MSVLRRVESRGALETAHRIKTVCGQVMRYAVATGRADRDPTYDLRGALPQAKVKHHPAFTDPTDMGKLLLAMDGYQGTFVVRCALRLAPMFFLRPGEFRKAEWDEFDLEKSMWLLPAEKMKGGRAHYVPLCKQASKVLGELKRLTGGGRYVFPSIRSNAKPMSENTINGALRGLGYGSDDVTGHGFRATARTMLAEVLGFDERYIEHQLAHTVRDPLGVAYNRAKFLAERKEMMQEWADYLDQLRDVTKLQGGLMS